MGKIFNRTAINNLAVQCVCSIIIIESVDSVNRDGPNTPIYVIHYKHPNISEQVTVKFLTVKVIISSKLCIYQDQDRSSKQVHTSEPECTFEK